MGYVMQSHIPIIVWNPKNDDRYNELIDIKTENPMYCFPLIELNKITQERKVVGCVQFENLQLRLLKGTQTIQQQNNFQNATHTSILIDEHMKSLMKEFGSYIAEVLKIIRNQKLLKRFKTFILRAQENENENQEIEEININQASEDISQFSSRVAPYKIDNDNDLVRSNLIQIEDLQTESKNDNIQIVDEHLQSASFIEKTKLDSFNRQLIVVVQPVQIQQTTKKKVGFALLKQMTKVNLFKQQDQEKIFMFDRKILSSKHISPGKEQSDQFLFDKEIDSIQLSPHTQKHKKIELPGNQSRNQQLTITNKNSAFDSESLQDSDEMWSFNRQSQNVIQIPKKRATTSSQLQSD